MADIATISTDDLVDELFSRFDCAVFVGEKRMTAEMETFVRKARGNLPLAMGLCADMIRRLSIAQDARERPGDGGGGAR